MAVAGLVRLVQDSWAAGSFPGLEVIPPDGAERIVNGFIQDDGSALRRGGSVYQSGVLSGTAGLVWDGELTPGRRTVALSTAGHLDVLDADDTSVIALGAADVSRAAGTWVRPLVAGGVLFLTPTLMYGGARRLGSYSTGTASVDIGSKLVTGVGTTWLTNAPPGRLFMNSAQTAVGVVESVQSDTQLTLRDTWRYTALVGDPYVVATFANVVYPPFAHYDSAKPAVLGTTAGSGRLLLAQGNRIRFGAAGGAMWLRFDNDDDYHELPDGVEIIGGEEAGGGWLAFSTAGVWSIRGLELDLTDDFGNPQQSLHRLHPEIALWGQFGLARWRDSVICPALDDVYLLDGAGGSRPIGGGVRNLYRSYVASGYQPGQASVYQGHYFLPVLNGTALVDSMVCRLDSGAWTFLSGNGGSSVAYATRVDPSSGASRLLGGSGTRIHNLAPAFTGAQADDPDGSSHELEVTTRTFTLGGAARQTWRRLVARMDLTGGTVTAQAAKDEPGAGFSSLSSTVSGDPERHAFTVRLRSRNARFRITQHGSSSNARLRGLEVFVRPNGRQ